MKIPQVRTDPLRQATARPRTLYEKIWDDHLVERAENGSSLIYIDRHLLHEVTSPQAFAALRARGRAVRRPDLTLAVPDHGLATTSRRGPTGELLPIQDRASAQQLAALETNTTEFGIPYIGPADADQGIVHVIGPELGFTWPGCTVVCGDSHTCSHGALGALGIGIGTSDIEHVLATQTLRLNRSKCMEVRVDGRLGFGVSAKDLILAVIGRLGSGGASGHVIEYRGPTFSKMSVEGRLTIANMSVEAGARSGLFAPDEKTFEYLKGRPLAPVDEDWEAAKAYWQTLQSDDGCWFDASVHMDAAQVAPNVTWGTSPDDVVPITARVPSPDAIVDPAKRMGAWKSLEYMDLRPGTPMEQIELDHIFIGSCTNGRIEDLRAAAAVLKGRTVSSRIKRTLVVPGSGRVKRQAEAEGLDLIFRTAGCEWREPGCSACLGMNADAIAPGERCASTSNRNFVGRQGKGSRTHLLSPAMAAAAAVTGRLTDVRQLLEISS